MFMLCLFLCLLAREGDTASNLGAAMDELMRHQPLLRDSVMTALINVGAAVFPFPRSLFLPVLCFFLLPLPCAYPGRTLQLLTKLCKMGTTSAVDFAQHSRPVQKEASARMVSDSEEDEEEVVSPVSEKAGREEEDEEESKSPVKG